MNGSAVSAAKWGTLVEAMIEVIEVENLASRQRSHSLVFKTGEHTLTIWRIAYRKR
jgi:hypothetical protein